MYKNKYEYILDKTMTDENIISHMISNKAFKLAEELHAVYGHKICDYIPLQMRWGEDNPEIGYGDQSSSHRGIVMSIDNMPSYYVYHTGDSYAISTPKSIRDKGNSHVTFSKNLASVMKSIKTRKAIPDNPLIDIFGLGRHYDIKTRYVNYIADVEQKNRELNNINLSGTILGELLRKALGKKAYVEGAVEKLANETLDKITNKEQDIESSIAESLCVFDKPMKVIGKIRGRELYYSYDMKIDNAKTLKDMSVKIVSDISLSDNIETLPCFDEYSGLLTMWKVSLPELISRKDSGYKINGEYFLHQSWGSGSIYSEDLGIIATELHSGSGCFDHTELAFLHLE